jgi:orotate phosphoribosyltransferase-like protein
MSKLTKQQIKDVFELREKGLTLKEISENYPVSLQAIAKILKNKKKNYSVKEYVIEKEITKEQIIKICIELLNTIE